jgi:4-hydroxybenzoate polyprenyltransferase
MMLNVDPTPTKRPKDLLTGTYLAATAAMQAVRPHHWLKNVLVFFPLILAQKYSEQGAIVPALIMFVALSLTASAGYIVNDLVDLESDRAHWSKSSRPIASGVLGFRQAAVLEVALLIGGLLMGAMVGSIGVILVLGYLAGSLTYSFYARRVALLDVFWIGGLFTYRLYCGVVACGLVLSYWLITFSLALFTSLALAKRHTELLRLNVSSTNAQRGYLPSDASLLMSLGVSASALAVIVLVLYVILDGFPAGLYRNPGYLLAIPSILFLWTGRIWLMSHRGQLNDDPVIFAMKDHVSATCAALVTVAFVFAI